MRRSTGLHLADPWSNSEARKRSPAEQRSETGVQTTSKAEGRNNGESGVESHTHLESIGEVNEKVLGFFTAANDVQAGRNHVDGGAALNEIPLDGKNEQAVG